MLNLPHSRADQNGLPLSEHSALMLVTGLLHDDLDDRHDVIRGVLEIDPLLACWAVCTANATAGIRLSSMQAATRWLSQSFLPLLDTSPALTSRQHNVDARSAWHKIVVNAVTAARQARQHAMSSREPATRAYWHAMLLSVKQQLDGFAKLNGKSPLRSISMTWPAWLLDLEISQSSQPSASQYAAIPTTPPVVVTEEQQLWFRPYPEFRLLVPLLAKQSQRLAALEERFEATLQREKLASLHQFAYGASHEINNPLANISTRAQTLVRHELDPDRRQKLNAINDQAFRAYEMIADLMLFAKPPKMEIQSVATSGLLATLRDELQSPAAEKGISVHLDYDAESDLQIEADPVQLSVAVKAICDNGIEAMTTGCLTIEIKPTRRHLEIYITDQGTGMDEAQRRHLFDPFYSGREAGRGLGFGLCKAWRIVEQHHGSIEVNSHRSGGCTFTVTLPMTQPGHVANAKPAVSEDT